jgi:dTMP kinase
MFGINHVLPDLTIVLMLRPEEGLKRISMNELREINRLDKEKLSLHQLVYNGYRKLIDENQNKNIVEVDASASVNEVFKKVIQIINNKIKEYYGE